MVNSFCSVIDSIWQVLSHVDGGDKQTEKAVLERRGEMPGAITTFGVQHCSHRARKAEVRGAERQPMRLERGRVMKGLPC